MRNTRQNSINAVIIQQEFRACRRRRPVRQNMDFVTSPHDHPLDLSKKEDRKLCEDACRGLEKEARFDGSSVNSSKFLKLIGKELNGHRLDEVLHVAVE